MNSTRLETSNDPQPLEIEMSGIDSASSDTLHMPPPPPPPPVAAAGSRDRSASEGGSEGPFRCACGKICQRREGLSQHRKICAAGENQGNLSTSLLFKCSLCDTHCGNSSALIKHKGSQKCQKRQLQRSKSESINLALSGSDTETSVESHGTQCSICHRIFKSKQGLVSHSRKCKVSFSIWKNC